MGVRTNVAPKFSITAILFPTERPKTQVRITEHTRKEKDSSTGRPVAHTLTATLRNIGVRVAANVPCPALDRRSSTLKLSNDFMRSSAHLSNPTPSPSPRW